MLLVVRWFVMRFLKNKPLTTNASEWWCYIYLGPSPGSQKYEAPAEDPGHQKKAEPASCTARKALAHIVTVEHGG